MYLQELLAYVTTPEKDSCTRRLFFSTIFSEQLQIFCAWQEKAPLNQTGSEWFQYIPLFLYSCRWNIEISYYEQKTFWSLCSYYRAMMGEYIIYYRDRIVGGIYDDRLLVKPTKSAVSYMANATYELPYEGAKEMLLVEDVDSKEYLAGLFNAMYDELPVHRRNPAKESRTRMIT